MKDWSVGGEWAFVFCSVYIFQFTRQQSTKMNNNNNNKQTSKSNDQDEKRKIKY